MSEPEHDFICPLCLTDLTDRLSSPEEWAEPPVMARVTSAHDKWPTKPYGQSGTSSSASHEPRLPLGASSGPAVASAWTDAALLLEVSEKLLLAARKS